LPVFLNWEIIKDTVTVIKGVNKVLGEKYSHESLTNICHLLQITKQERRFQLQTAKNDNCALLQLKYIIC
jgi:hypothetical protein